MAEKPLRPTRSVSQKAASLKELSSESGEEEAASARPKRKAAAQVTRKAKSTQENPIKKALHPPKPEKSETESDDATETEVEISNASDLDIPASDSEKVDEGDTVHDLDVKQILGSALSEDFDGQGGRERYYLFSFHGRGYMHSRWLKKEDIERFRDCTRRMNIYNAKHAIDINSQSISYPPTLDIENVRSLLPFSFEIRHIVIMYMRPALLFDGRVSANLFPKDALIVQRILQHRRIKRPTHYKEDLFRTQNRVGLPAGIILPIEDQSRTTKISRDSVTKPSASEITEEVLQSYPEDIE